jgi:hypothetical protein
VSGDEEEGEHVSAHKTEDDAADEETGDGRGSAEEEDEKREREREGEEGGRAFACDISKIFSVSNKDRGPSDSFWDTTHVAETSFLISPLPLPASTSSFMLLLFMLCMSCLSVLVIMCMGTNRASRGMIH